jgi:putative ABC transport system ATP-binding protein
MRQRLLVITAEVPGICIPDIEPGCIPLQHMRMLWHDFCWQQGIDPIGARPLPTFRMGSTELLQATSPERTPAHRIVIVAIADAGNTACVSNIVAANSPTNFFVKNVFPISLFLILLLPSSRTSYHPHFDGYCAFAYCTITWYEVPNINIQAFMALLKHQYIACLPKREGLRYFMITVKNIVKTYQTGTVGLTVLKSISAHIDKGEMVAIMGPSGSGKSTLMNIIGCLDRPTSGSYSLDGQEVAKLSENQLADVRSHKIGFVFQQFNLLSRSSALRNVELPMIYSGAKNRGARAKSALERVGLADRMDHRPNQLSGGQQQRVAIARAIVNEPLVIMADEPTGALDTKTGEEIMRIFQELNNEGKTVIVVTHEPEIAQHCNRIIRFKDGEIVSDEPVHDKIML